MSIRDLLDVTRALVESPVPIVSGNEHLPKTDVIADMMRTHIAATVAAVEPLLHHPHITIFMSWRCPCGTPGAETLQVYAHASSELCDDAVMAEVRAWLAVARAEIKAHEEKAS